MSHPNTDRDERVRQAPERIWIDCDPTLVQGNRYIYLEPPDPDLSIRSNEYVRADLLDSQAADELYPPVTNTGRGRCRHNVPTCGECQTGEVLAHVAEKEKVANDAATRMRDACIAKVREMRDEWESKRNGLEPLSKMRNRYDAAFCAANQIMLALESLTLDQVEQEKR